MAFDILSIVIRIGEIFGAPFFKPELFWILVPVYVSWVINDLMTDEVADEVNFMASGFTALWVGMEWGRELTSELTIVNINNIISIQGILAMALLVYGLATIIASVRKSDVAKFIGRNREITYLLICLTPIFYGVVAANNITILAIAIFFPVFWILGFILDKLITFQSR